MENWDYKELGKIFEINTKSINPQKIDEELIHYSLPAFDSKQSPIIQQSKEIQSNKTLVEKETLLVSKLNPRISRVWYVKEIDENLKSVSSTEFINYISEMDIDLNFYYQYFKSDIFQEELLSLESGTTGSRKRVTPKDTLSIKLPMPSIQEQQKIASILSTVEEHIDETDQLIEKTKELKKGLMQQLLTKGIGHTEFKQIELGEIPSEWNLFNIEDIALKVTDGEHKTPLRTESGELLLSARNIKNGKLDLTNVDYVSQEELEKITKRCNPEEGDILISCSGSVGRVCVVPNELKFGLVRSVALIKVDRAYVCEQFLMYALQSPPIQKQMEKTQSKLAQANLFLRDINKLKIPFPPFAEQQKIASILSTVDEQIEAYEQEKAKYEELKKGLMQQLLTGKIRVKI